MVETEVKRNKKIWVFNAGDAFSGNGFFYISLITGKILPRIGFAIKKIWFHI